MGFLPSSSSLLPPSTSISFLSVQPMRSLSASCLRRHLDRGPPPDDYKEALWSIILTHSGPLEPGRAHCARRSSLFHLCWSGTASRLHLSPLRKSEGWEEASRPVPRGIWTHSSLRDRDFTLHTDEKTLNKCWSQASDIARWIKIRHTAKKQCRRHQRKAVGRVQLRMNRLQVFTDFGVFRPVYFRLPTFPSCCLTSGCSSLDDACLSPRATCCFKVDSSSRWLTSMSQELDQLEGSTAGFTNADSV